MSTITKKPVVFYIKTNIFDELKIKLISSNVTDFLQVNSAWYNLKIRIRSFLTVPEE